MLYWVLSWIPDGLEPLRKKFEELIKKAGQAAIWSGVLWVPACVEDVTHNRHWGINRCMIWYEYDVNMIWLWYECDVIMMWLWYDYDMNLYDFFMSLYDMIMNVYDFFVNVYDHNMNVYEPVWS